MCRSAPARAFEVPVLIDSPVPSSAPQPVTFGVPFPRGALRETSGWHLTDTGGRRVAAQGQVLGRWSDGSVRWLLIDALLSSLTGGCTAWALLTDPGEDGPDPAVRVRDLPDSVVVDTGQVHVRLDRRTLALPQVQVAGHDVLDGSSSRVVLRDRRDGEARARLDELVVESAGPVRATIRMAGGLVARGSWRVIFRLSAFAGTGLLRLELTLHNPRRARHRGGLWDLGDPGSLLFRELAVRLGVAGGVRGLTWSPEPAAAPRSTEEPRLEIYQESSGGTYWRSRVHVNHRGEVPLRFRGYRLREGGAEWFGLRASPLVTLQSPRHAIGVAVPEFWQQFPKAIAVDETGVTVGLFPSQFPDLHELQGGEQKTHTLWLSVGQPGQDVSLDWVHHPAVARATPKWCSDTRAVSYLVPEDREGDGHFATVVREAIAGEGSLLGRREGVDEYGWRNFGDVHADHEAAGYRGPLPIVSHYNNQYDLLFGCLLQFLRTGDARWHAVADPLARHVIDIDIYHTDRDRAAYNGGLFWHTDHHRDAATATHRSYSRSNAPPDGPYGGGPGNTHNYTSGLLLYHYLTGSSLARDAVLSLARWVIAMDDGRQHLLGWLDDGPTGLATHNGEPEFSGPGRGAGNSVNALLDAWEVTGEPGYLDKAEELIRRVIHPADHVDERNLLDVEPRWSYTVFLSVLARYLAAKEEAGQTDRMYAYGTLSLLTYARWMLNHERPYLDHADRLQFPTETWAAHDLRKANVMRLAAEHAPEALRRRLQNRARELSTRAWEGLLAFPTWIATRPLAIVLTEAAKECGLTRWPRTFAQPAPEDAVMGTPTRFRYQKDRVAAALRRPDGWVRLAARLVTFRSWPHTRPVRVWW